VGVKGSACPSSFLAVSFTSSFTVPPASFPAGGSSTTRTIGFSSSGFFSSGLIFGSSVVFSVTTGGRLSAGTRITSTSGTEVSTRGVVETPVVFPEGFTSTGTSGCISDVTSGCFTSSVSFSVFSDVSGSCISPNSGILSSPPRGPSARTSG